MQGLNFYKLSHARIFSVLEIFSLVSLQERSLLTFLNFLNILVQFT